MGHIGGDAVEVGHVTPGHSASAALSQTMGSGLRQVEGRREPYLS